MMSRLLLCAIVALLASSHAIAADYVNPGTLYPVPQIFGGGGSPTQVDYDNAYVALRQFTPRAGGGTLVSDQSVRISDLIAGAPAFASLQQRIDASFSQLQATMQQNQQIAIQAQQTAIMAQRGVTATAAMANIWMPSAPGRTAWAVNGANFQGEYGAGFSIAHRLNVSVPIAITASYGNGAGSAHVSRIGLMGEF